MPATRRNKTVKSDRKFQSQKYDATGIEMTPNECKISLGEYQCMYCTRILPARPATRACAVCDGKWSEAFGLDWWTKNWHQELVGVNDAFIASEGQVAASFNDDVGASQIESLPLGWRPAPNLCGVFEEVKSRTILGRTPSWIFQLLRSMDYPQIGLRTIERWAALIRAETAKTDQPVAAKPKTGRKTIADSVKNEIFAAYESGLSIRRAAEKLRLPHALVQRHYGKIAQSCTGVRPGSKLASTHKNVVDRQVNDVL